MTEPNIVLNVNGIEVIYNHVILVLKGVSLQVPEGGIVALLGRQRRGQDDHAARRLQPAGGRARRGHQGHDRAARRAHRDAVAGRPGAARRGAGDGRPALLRPPDDRGKPADRRLHAQRRQGGGGADAGEGLRLLPAPEDAAHLAGGLHLGRRAADVRHRPRADGQPDHGAARRAVDGPGAADRRGGVRDREGPERARSASPSCWPSRTPTWRCATPTTATSWRTAAS